MVEVAVIVAQGIPVRLLCTRATARILPHCEGCVLPPSCTRSGQWGKKMKQFSDQNNNHTHHIMRTWLKSERPLDINNFFPNGFLCAVCVGHKPKHTLVGGGWVKKKRSKKHQRQRAPELVLSATLRNKTAARGLTSSGSQVTNTVTHYALRHCCRNTRKS